MAKWTREHVIREILRREAANLPLSLKHGWQGVDSKLYRAAARVFGGWRNALMAAGVSPRKVLAREQWPSAKIITTIKSLARRRQVLSLVEVNHRYPQLVDAARRRFGSWPKAVIAAGIDPVKLRRAPPWTRDRIIQVILARALNDERLGSHNVQPKSLAEAGARVFGSWEAAIVAAGLDARSYVQRPESLSPDLVAHLDNRPGRSAAAEGPAAATGVALRWTSETVAEAIVTRLHEHQPVNSATVRREARALYRAGERLFGNWRRALEAAHLDPDEFRGRRGPRGGEPDKSIRARPVATANETCPAAACAVASDT